jgi:hypothetical protein
MGQKGRKKDVSPHSGRNLRIKFIHEFVCGEMGNQGAMLEFVNNKLKSHGLEGIEKATLQADISYLNSGDFLSDDEKSELRPFSEKKYFNAVLNKKTGSYYYENDIQPSLNFLNEQEQMTLPFLTSVLDPYGDVPAFQKFLKQAASLFDKDLDSVESKSAFAVSGPTFSFKGYKSRMIDKVLQLLGHIQREEVISFEYLKSSSMELRKDLPETIVKATFKPLCIRLYQNLYYLTGIWDGNKLHSLINYRIDFIVDGSIKTIPLGPDTMKVRTFSKEEEKRQSDMENVLKRSLGVWIHGNDHIVERIILRFHGWAGKHLLTFDIHPSQKKVSKNEGGHYVDFEFELYTYNSHLLEVEKEEQERERAILAGEIHPENRPYLPWLNRYPEAGYIFGRYINYIELINIHQI